MAQKKNYKKFVREVDYMYLPKADILNRLNELGHKVTQIQPTVFNELPVLVFQVIGNSNELFLDNTIATQSIDVQIDIWADSSVEASNLLSQVEEKMRSDFYNLNYSADVPNNGNIFHIVTRFNKKI